MLCKFCKRPLKDSQYSSDGKFKSCPRCSVINGEEHIYFPYPNSFGTTEKRKTAARPEGPQSYCANHRPNPHNPISSGGVLCSEIRFRNADKMQI